MDRRSRQPVRVCVIGDEGVGKTSLITAAATESFPDSPPPVLPVTKLPPDSTPEGIPVQIWDTSSRAEDRPTLEVACMNADVIVLLFATDKPQTLARVRSYWMPELRRLGASVPVVLLGTKSDIKPPDQELQELVVPVMNEFKEIETCLECSAKKLIFVSEVFYYALKSVLHPTAALFNPQNQTLKPLCVAALTRIFKMCDKDRDGALNDEELNTFQVKCFNAPLQPEELLGVKRVVQEKMEHGVNGVGLTLPGFLFLHALFIERGRLETTWAVLRKFGYNNDLLLEPELLEGAHLQHAPDQVMELTPAARAFLRTAFIGADRDGDALLSPEEVKELFETAPDNPWVDNQEEAVMVESLAGSLTLDGFMAKWVAMTAREPRRALAYFLYLGYEGDGAQLFHASRPRRQDRKAEQPDRSVYQCFLLGGSGVGKSSLLGGLVGQQAPAASSAHYQPVAAGCVDADGATATLILSEWDEEATAALLESPAAAEQLAACDVAAVVFDSSDLHSFHTAHRLLLQIAQAAGDRLPCVLIAAKDDLGMDPDVVAECSEAAAALRLRMPLSVSTRVGETASVYIQLVHAARDPQHYIPLTPSLEAVQNYRRLMRRALLYTAAGTAAGVAIYFSYRWVQGRTLESHAAESASAAAMASTESSP